MTEQTEKDRATLVREADSAATSRLREKYKDEFNELKTQEAKDRGVDWSPRLTAEQRQEEDLAGLLRQRPDLAEKYGLRSE